MSTYERLMVPLINHWTEVQRQCTKLGHREKQVAKMLDYGHVQIVYLCPECLARGQKEHKELYAKITAKH